MKIIRNILFYLFSFLLCFFIGILFANLIEAGKGQMLAGGAIVLFHGLIGALIGLILAITISVIYRQNSKVVIQSNKILAALIIVMIAFFWIRNSLKQAEVDKTSGHFININKVITEQNHYTWIRI